MDIWGRRGEEQEAGGLSLLASAFPSLSMEAGRREASEKLWGRCGTELRAPRPFPSGACWGDGAEGATQRHNGPRPPPAWTGRGPGTR